MKYIYERGIFVAVFIKRSGSHSYWFIKRSGSHSYWFIKRIY